MMKKVFIIILMVVFFLSNNAFSFEMIDNNLDQQQKRLILELLPFDAAKNAEIFINGGSPEKYTAQKQIFYYTPASNKKIKIDIYLPRDSEYKSKIYEMDENLEVDNITIKLTLYKKISPETRRIAKLIISSINSYIEYKESGNINLLRKTTKDLGALYYIDKFISEISEYDDEELEKFLEVIKREINLTAVNNDIFNKVTENIKLLKRVSMQLSDLKNIDGLTIQDKKSRQDKLTNQIMEIFWNCFDLKTLLNNQE